MSSRVHAHLAVDEAERLLSARGRELDELLARAARCRDEGLVAAGRSKSVTYSRKVFIPLTTLCRDRCHYCVFVDTPAQLAKKHRPAYMSPDQVLAVAAQGAALGCKEALLTLGDRPEDRWPEARAWLDDHGYASTIDYVAAMAELVTAETGMLAHANPGVMSADELARLRRVAPSMGMMLETTSRDLFERRGQVHYGSPDKDPAVRLGVIEEAGRRKIPFTTGILVGIGETIRDRAESLIAIRDAHARHGHVQEVIIQNFRAKPHTAMRDVPDAATQEYLAAIAVARLVLGPDMRIQVPPNLTDPDDVRLLIRAGADDWGGVSPLTADHVNPERPWPHLGELAAVTAETGYTLRERLTAQPEFVRASSEWIDERLHDAVQRLADPNTGLARLAADGSPLHPAHGRRSERTADSPTPRAAVRTGAGAPAQALRRLVDRAVAEPESVDDEEWSTLLRADGDGLDALARAADDVRRYTVGEAVSFVVNRNLTSSGLGPESSDVDGAFRLSDVAAIAHDASDLGATEICVQGALGQEEDPAGYLEIAHEIKRAEPMLHLHAYRPNDIADFAVRTGLDLEGALVALRNAGVDTLPGTGVKILDERIRERIAPDDLPIERWSEIVAGAHRLGFRTSSVIFYGHVETADQRISHLRRLAQMQAQAIAAGGRGFTELVPIPLPGGGGRLVPGRALIDEHRAMFAVSRLMLVGSIAHIQVPWTRVGFDEAAELLRCGADDLGGTLFDGRVLPRAGVEFGREMQVHDARVIARKLFRPLRQRTTDYGEPPTARKAALR
ncbi:bifunctional FO biosynthesis protein CofGH [Agromyces tropicus]|uniref:7,8-didemethyl-8-hydroxy-5-deazariboflavin synthase n=1 Tax=Agromyces tropicus TaxID=555371 RepID=A0ABN2USW1_9MICO